MNRARWIMAKRVQVIESTEEQSTCLGLGFRVAE